MRRIYFSLVAVSFLSVAAACSDTSPTAAVPIDNAALVKLPGGSGGVGNPAFDPDNTSCTFDEGGELACKYKMTGLGKNGSALVTLIGLVQTTWDCVNPSTLVTVVSGRSEMRLALNLTTFADQSGNAKGTISAYPRDLTPIVNCPFVQVGTEQRWLFGRWVTVPVYAEARVENVRYSLNAPSVTNGEPDVTGEWALFGVVKTGKALSTAFYSGSL